MILKNFWSNNDRFADLFNTVLFNGKSVVDPEKLVEADTDMGGVVKRSGNAQTLQRTFDVVKKTERGVEFVVLGLENQEKVHYAMPLRHMLGDALAYLKEYKDVARINREEHLLKSDAEFLSKMKKTDRLHPVISLCIYYGDEEWDGPLCLKDMLDIPDELQDAVLDYDMHLVQINASGELNFQNKDVQTVFETCRMIYRNEYDELNTLYKENGMDAEVALAVGAITNSQSLIKQALEMDEEGGCVNMCKALEELEQKGRMEGIRMMGIKFLKMGYPVEMIAQAAEVSIETVQHWLTEDEKNQETNQILSTI